MEAIEILIGIVAFISAIAIFVMSGYMLCKTADPLWAISLMASVLAGKALV